MMEWIVNDVNEKLGEFPSMPHFTIEEGKKHNRWRISLDGKDLTGWVGEQTLLAWRYGALHGIAAMKKGLTR